MEVAVKVQVLEPHLVAGDQQQRLQQVRLKGSEKHSLLPAKLHAPSLQPASLCLPQHASPSVHAPALLSGH
jgi:hypothetical protein